MVKAPGTAASLIKVPEFKSQLHFPFSFLKFIPWKAKGATLKRQIRFTKTKSKIFDPLPLPKWPQWSELNRSKARSQELLPVLPCGCRVPRLWAILDYLPRPQAGS